MKSIISVITVLLMAQTVWASCGDKTCKDKSCTHTKGKFFKKMDIDKDGKISKVEFQSMHDKKFAEMDSNSDGFVDKQEKKSFHKAKKAKHKGHHGGH